MGGQRDKQPLRCVRVCVCAHITNTVFDLPSTSSDMLVYDILSDETTIIADGKESHSESLKLPLT